MSLSRELTTRPDCQFLSCSALAIVTLYLLACFTRVAFWRVAQKKKKRKEKKNIYIYIYI